MLCLVLCGNDLLSNKIMFENEVPHKQIKLLSCKSYKTSNYIPNKKSFFFKITAFPGFKNNLFMGDLNLVFKPLLDEHKVFHQSEICPQ